MINRILIRIKVLQVLYAYYQNGTNDLKVAENELVFSLQKSYDLYYYFLLLIINMTDLQERILDARKHKYRPTEEELHPNMRMVENRFARQLRENEAFKAYVEERTVSWMDDQDFLKSTLELILSSDVYKEYLENPEDDYETDRNFWKAVFKQLIADNDAITEYLEDKSIYWNDDIDVIQSYVLKTIKRFRQEEGAKQELLPMFKDREDRAFAVKLFRETILKGPQMKERISRHTKNWETERVANMDLLIMQLAITEIMTFPSIPVSVSLNEYIDMGKYYSTPKSGVFINGILDSVVEELKKENLLFKD